MPVSSNVGWQRGATQPRSVVDAYLPRFLTLLNNLYTLKSIYCNLL